MKVLVFLAAILPCISSQMPGGTFIFHPNMTDPEVVFAVEAINDMYRNIDDYEIRYAVCIPYATYQVVEGYIYTYDIVVTGVAGFQICNVKVWSRPWLNSTLLQGEPRCMPRTPDRRGMVGAPVVYHPRLNDPEVVYAVGAINVKYNSEGDYRMRYPICIPYATSQVVAGVLFTYDILVTGVAGFQFCHVQVWSRPWLNSTLLQGEPICGPADGGIIVGDVSGNSNPELLQGMPGGQESTDLSDPI